MNLARRFNAGKESNEIAYVASATPESVGCSTVANATGDAVSFSYPALKRRAELTPTLRVESLQCSSQSGFTRTMTLFHRSLTRLLRCYLGREGGAQCGRNFCRLTVLQDYNSHCSFNRQFSVGVEDLIVVTN